MTPISLIFQEGLLSIALTTCGLAAVYLAVASLVLGGFGQPVAIFLFGYFIWTLIEYLLHRFVLHWEPQEQPWQSVRKCFPKHRGHHNSPAKPRSDGIGMLKFVVGLSLASVGLLSIALPVWLSLSANAGILVGYLSYEYFHSACHFLPLRFKYFNMLKRHHAIHHHRDETVNFGVTTMFWDKLFGTTWQPARAPANAR